MNYTINHQSTLEHTITFTFTPQEFNARVTQKALVSAKKIRHKGFRTGQVPMQVAKQMLGQALYYEVAAELAEKHYQEVLDKENITPAGIPELNVTYAEENRGTECVLSYSTYPEITLPKWSELTIDVTDVSTQDNDIDAVIQVMRERNPTWIESEEPAQEKDRVTVNFEGKVDGEPFAGGSAQDQQLVIGSGGFLPDFEQALVGMKKGDTKNAPVGFPEDYQSTELAGKTADFALTVTRVEKSQLPELNEAFFISQGSQAKTVDDFTADIKKNVKRHVRGIAHSNMREACMKALKEAVEFDLPEQLLAQEKRRLQQEAISWLERSGNKIDDAQKETLFPLEQFAERAKERISQWLLFQAVSDSFDVKVSDTDIDAFLKEEGDDQSDYMREQTIIRLKNAPEERQQIEGAITERKVFDLLCEQTKVTHATSKPYMDYFKQNS